MDWIEVLPEGMICDLNETGLLTPDEARAKAAELITAADTIDRGLHRLIPGLMWLSRLMENDMSDTDPCTMTRADAIEYVFRSAAGIAGECATSSEEEAEFHQDARVALVALGVTQDELKTAGGLERWGTR